MQKPSRKKISFTKVPLAWVGLVAVILLINWFFRDFFLNSRQQGGSENLKAQAIQQAQQAVREKVGDSLTVVFSANPAVEEASSTYTVRSQFISTSRRGEKHAHPYIVTLEYKGNEGTEATKWQVVSTDIGQ